MVNHSKKANRLIVCFLLVFAVLAAALLLSGAGRQTARAELCVAKEGPFTRALSAGPSGTEQTSQASEALPDEAKTKVQHVFDQAGLLTPEEIEEFEKSTEEIYQTYGQEILLVTTDDTGGKSPRDYADDFYDDYFENNAVNGGLILVDMQHRKVWISTSDSLIDILTDQDIEQILDAGYSELGDKDYGAAFRNMLAEMRHKIDRGRLAGQYREAERGPNRLSTFDGIAALAAGLAGGGGLFGSVRKSYKGKPRPMRYSRGEANCLVSFGGPDDWLLDSRVTRVPIPRAQRASSGSSSSGRSSTHRSSSGRTHGGGGRSF